MKNSDLLAAPPDWTNPSWADRIDMCASMLYVHGYIPLSTRDKIAKKLTAQFAQAIEARRAETQSGSVHESAVGAADAPESNQP